MKKAILFITAFVGLLLVGCRTSDLDHGGGEYEQNGFKLSFDVLNPVNQTRSTVPPLPGEEQINTMHVFFFEHSNSGSGKFVESVFVKNDDGSPIGNMGAIEVFFPAGSSLNSNTNYNLLICANVSDSELGDVFTGLDENAAALKLQLKITETHSDEDRYEQIIKSDRLPMSGRVVRYANQGSSHVDLTRAVSRFDVVNQDENYKLVSVSIWNAFKNTNVWENTLMDFSTARTMRYYGVNGLSENKSEGQLYAYENYVNKPEEKDRNTTCLILGFENEGEVYYYRVNVNARNIGQYLKRNNVYKTTVKRVLDKGEATEDSAYNSRELLLDVDVNGWSVDDGGNIQYDGRNILATPASTIYFNSEGGILEYHIYTYGEFELAIFKKELPSGITARLYLDSENRNMLEVTATSSREEKSGVIGLKFGELSIEVPVVQTGTDAPVLELKPSGFMSFPATGTFTTEPVTVTSSGKWVAKLYDNDRHFTFANGGLNTTGESGESFHVICNKDNQQTVQYHAFLIVSLDGDPSVNRTIVLTQLGEGGFALNPDYTNLSFSAVGMAMDLSRDYYYEFEVGSSDGIEELAWSAEIISGYNFQVDVQENTFRVTGDFNTGAEERNAVLRVMQEGRPASSILIDIFQDGHTLALIPSTTVGDFYAEGGDSPSIRVNSSFDWTATITSPNNIAKFGNNSTVLSGRDEGEFSIHVSPLPYMYLDEDQDITVTVKVNNKPGAEGTMDIGQTISIKQYGLFRKPVRLESLRDYYSALSYASAAYTPTRMRNNMLSSLVTGPDAPIHVLEPFSFVSDEGRNSWRMPAAGVDIFQINCFALTVANGNEIRPWLEASKNRLLIISGDYISSARQPILKNLGYGFDGGSPSPSVSSATRRTVRAGVTHPLFDYLFRNGPFTDGTNDIREGVSLRVRDTDLGQAIDWPDTFIPIIMNPNNSGACLFGIDPTLRIIYFGDTDMFRSDYDNFNGTRPANELFLNNLIAWMTYATKYGDVFLNQFK